VVDPDHNGESSLVWERNERYESVRRCFVLAIGRVGVCEGPLGKDA